VTEFEKLVAALIGHAYDTGYYSGKLEDATPHHLKAIGDRVRAQYALLAQVKALVEACHYAPLATLAHRMDIEGGGGDCVRRILDALPFFEEATDGTSG